MIYEDNGKKVLLLNLEKQVQKNKEDIEYIVNQEGALNQFGLKVVGQVDTIGDMPTVQAYKESNPKWEYGDAFMVGVSTAEATVVDVDNAILLVLTRANTTYPADFWMNLKEFPKPGPIGPQGKQGEQGIQGEKGLGVISGTQLPSTNYPVGTTFINATTGDVFVYSGQKWDKIGNIKGATGSVGPVGPQGKTGPIGPTGATGPQGPRGIGVNILGTLTSTSQLPNPTTVGKDSAYIIPADGVNHLWVIEGTDNLVWTDFGTAGLGEKGDKGDAGIGIDTMTNLDLTYGETTVDFATDVGMTINSQARFTYGGTTKDVPMKIELPIVAGDGITIDKSPYGEQVEIKADTDALGGFFMPLVGYGQIPAVDYSSNVVGKYYGPFSGGIPTYSDDNLGEDTGGNFLYAMTTGSENLADADKSKFRLTNKQYVDDGFVPKRTTTGSDSYVYAYSKGGDNGLRVSGEAVASTIPFRFSNGTLKVGTPVGVNDATTKAYVDGLHHYTHIISLVGSNNTIYITIAAKGYPNPITAIDDAGSTPSLSDLLLASGQSAKSMATGLVTDLDGSKGTVVALWSDSGSVMVEFIKDGVLSSNSVLALGTYTITDVVA